MQLQHFVRSKTWLAALLTLALLALAGCAGSNDVKYEEKSSVKSHKQFTSFTFIEDDDSDSKAPADVKAALATEIRDYWEKQLKNLEDTEKRAQAMGALKNMPVRTMTVHYKIVSYDPGNPWLRRALGFFGVGATKLVVDSRYLDENGQELSSNRISEALADAPELLESDKEILASMFVTTQGDYISHKKDYIVHPEQYCTRKC